MSQWLLVIVLAACGVLFLAAPFLKARKAEGASETVQASATPPRAGRIKALGFAVAVIGGAAGLYMATEPSAVEAPSSNFSLPATADATQPKLPDVDTMIGRIVERLKKTPDNAEDWRMLGWSYFETQHYPEAVDAYSHAVSLQPESAAYQSAYGEAQVLAASGKTTPEAMKAFAVALKGAPNDERALHFAGLVKKEKGDSKGAVADWLRALKNVKPDSPWAPRLRAEIAETAKLASIDVSKDLPPAAPMSDETFAAAPAQLAQQAQNIPAQEQQAMIKTMVAGLDERLARNPRDRDGWVRLIRSRKVLGEPELARTALDRALTAFQDDPTTQVALKAAAMELGVTAVR